ncbi:hypothetical protein ACFC6L_15980 [Kitasatospora phosalacinea]|uniref:hypothetical protein n=1 Tax=Kitasatospora phosalacinea TaxID=2065 RepID=UPI0035D79F62
MVLFDVPLNALQAAVVPDHLRSRVSGAFATVNYGVRPLGALLGTALGLRPALLTAVVGGSLAVLRLLPSPVPRVRTLDALAPVDAPVDVPVPVPAPRAENGSRPTAGAP